MSLQHLTRTLLSSSSSSGCEGEDDSHHDTDEAFNHVYYVMLFVAVLFFAGKMFAKIGMPALVGEIVFGIVLGPHLLNLPGDEGCDFLIVIGEIGLVMLVVEAGIDVDVGMLKLIGPRGVGIAVMGSIFPMSMGFCISYLTMATDVQTSIAIGACFAPTSMGIALNVLKKARLLNTPTGQLIIAAAILDDVLALIILTEIQAMSDPTAVNIILPLIVSPVLIVVVGYLAIRWIPKGLKPLMSRVPEEKRETAILGFLFLATFIFVPMVHSLGSSHLLGAFLAGLCFCTDHTIHHAWDHQIKRVLQWMLRIFFAATIGFQIPILEFGSGTVILRGIVYCFAGIGKVVQGFFSQPLNAKEFFIVGYSMSAWGEFAFILATTSYAEGTMDKESFSAVLLAVLLSVILSPYGLTATISYFERKAQKSLEAEMAKYGEMTVHPLYFAINSKSRGQWGHQGKILRIIFELNLEIIDFRSWHAAEFNHSHHQPLTRESFYVRDMDHLMPPTRHLNEAEKRRLVERVQLIREKFLFTLGMESSVSIKRWLPGITVKDDTLNPADSYREAMFGGEFKPKIKKSAEYCRKKAFKQAHSIMSVMQQKATIEEIKRVSSKNLVGVSEIQRQNSIKQLQKEIGVALDVPIDDNQADTSVTYSVQPHDHEGHFSGRSDLAGRGHGGQKGGAGVLPITSKTINIVSHFDGKDGARNWNTELSEIDYIYGDEDSEHHKLPDYSLTKTPQLLANYTPQIRSLNVPSRPLAMQTLAEDEEHDDHHHKMEQAIEMAPNEENTENDEPKEEQSEQWSQPLSFSDQTSPKRGAQHQVFDSEEMEQDPQQQMHHNSVTPLVQPMHVASIHNHGPPELEQVRSNSTNGGGVLGSL